MFIRIRSSTKHWNRWPRLVAPCVAGSLWGGGCSVENALLDGVFVGITDTVAGIISGVALGILGLQ